MVIEYQACSDLGCVRSNNEDMILIDRQFLRDESAEGKIMVGDDDRFAAIVADGMGGNDGGELASDIAAQEFDTWFAELPAGLQDSELRTYANDYATATHALINARGRELEGFQGMGTTLTGAFHYESRWCWINIGDSRVYIYRDGILRQVSRDHSYRNLYNDPNQPSNMIYNSLGGGEEYDSFADCDSLPLFPDDHLLVCSDGLSDMLDDTAIEGLMASSASAADIVAAAKQAGGRDNVSVILLQFTE